MDGYVSYIGDLARQLSQLAKKEGLPDIAYVLAQASHMAKSASAEAGQEKPAKQ